MVKKSVGFSAQLAICSFLRYCIGKSYRVTGARSAHTEVTSSTSYQCTPGAPILLDKSDPSAPFRIIIVAPAHAGVICRRCQKN
uniref:Uncharacterized protein n=1 Tax=Rhipicephalus zambeziensis TaxID=60191 RepID=A0A224YE57_9ACAR